MRQRGRRTDRFKRGRSRHHVRRRRASVLRANEAASPYVRAARGDGRNAAAAVPQKTNVGRIELISR